MKRTRRPPRLLFKTLAVTFATVAVLLVAVFVVVTLSVRDQVRETITANLDSTQRLFAALEARRQRELRAQAATLAESPTLKAALDTYAAEARTAGAAHRTQLLATIERELVKVAARIDTDALVLVDAHQTVLAAAGRLADRWPAGQPVALADAGGQYGDGVARTPRGEAHRLVTVPLELGDVRLGSLYLATSLDDRLARELDALSDARIAIVSDGAVLATTLPPDLTRPLEAALRSEPAARTLVLDGDAYATERLVRIGSTSFYALGSINDASRAAVRRGMRTLATIALGATALALVGSLWLARLVTRPIGRLSASLQDLAASGSVGQRLALSGSSRELDLLTDTFNALLASVQAAQAQTDAAYTGAIRALAAALDARDPYTAGHSERVSVLSVAIARELGVSAEDQEVIRLGALLHDIGKIGVPDSILRKPGALTASEYDVIKQHPSLGARILQSVPFLTRHLPIVELHHERPDGRGYPHGLRGDDIPLAARIVHVADAFDAITSARAYRGALPERDALRELWRWAGSEFSADIVAALSAALPGVMTGPSGVARQVRRA